MNQTNQVFTTVDACVDEILKRLGNELRLGLPLGLGKPVELVNALYRRAQQDPSIQLTILTALTLEKPEAQSDLEAAFLEPFAQRVWGECPDLQYAIDARKKQLPANVKLHEFYFKPGSRLGDAQAQQNYISSNYTAAARDIFNAGCNLMMQLVCRPGNGDTDRVSLSCNPDTSLELVRMMRASNRPHLAVGGVNNQLPYFADTAEVPVSEFDLIVDDPACYTGLFSTPKTPVDPAEYALGMHVSSLVKDGGTLQLGIGTLTDAVVHALRLRHTKNAAYTACLAALNPSGGVAPVVQQCGGTAPFVQGLYGATEMFVDGFLYLMQCGVLKRRVFAHEVLQRWMNAQEGRLDPWPLDILDQLHELGLSAISEPEFKQLQHHGLFNRQLTFQGTQLVLPNGQKVLANLADPMARKQLAAAGLGDAPKHGVVLHAGFFLGPKAMYAALNEMSEAERHTIHMLGVEHVNQLDLNPALYRAQRIHARFINTGLMVTLSGAVASDGLENGQVLSGVGGQFNFVSMAQKIDTGRSVLMIRAIREDSKGEVSSNVVFNYGHCTIPRHLRDVIVTEYGIADLRSRSDSEIVKALLNVADSRFQPELLKQAKEAGKLEQSYEIPAAYRNNVPARLLEAMQPCRREGLLPAFPFGSDFTAEEEVLALALKDMKLKAATTPKWQLLWRTLTNTQPIDPMLVPYLERMNLMQPQGLKNKVAQRLLAQCVQGVLHGN